MTMIDEGFLTEALHRAADSFEVSSDARSRIVAEVRATEVGPTAAVRFMHSRRSRSLVAVAAAIIVALAIALPLRNQESPSVHAASLGQKRVVVHGNAAYGAVGLTVNGSGTALTASGYDANGGAGEKTVVSAQRIESDGTVALVVPSGKVAATIASLTKLAAGDDGLVDSTNAYGGAGSATRFSSGTVVLQVPQSSFALLVAQVQRVGHATSVTTNSNDVTAHYVDLQARIHALEVSRSQYLAIMTRATTISAILAVQSQINQLQSQIEQFQGQLKVLNNETTFASVTINIVEKGHTSSTNHRRTGFAKAWHDSVVGFVDGFEWLLRLAGPLLFAALLLGALYALARLARRSFIRRRL
jgi:hypothetical protein